MQIMAINGVASVFEYFGIEQDGIFSILKETVLVFYNFLKNLNTEYLPFGLGAVVTILLFLYLARLLLGGSNG